MTALTLAVALALAGDPVCGARPGIEPARIVAVAKQESGLDPLVIGANADPARGLPHQVMRSATLAEAASRAAALIASGRSVDLGIAGINASNLERDGLTLATAFDACASFRAAYHHLAVDFEAAAWEMAHRRYNTGSFERGAGYAASVQAVLAQVRNVDAAPVVPAAPSLPGWNVWDQADHRAGQISADPFFQATPPAGRPLTAPVVMLHGLVAEKD